MGTWGAGNFDNDAAGDYLDSIKQQLVKAIEDCLAGKTEWSLFECGEEQLMPSVDLLCLICEHYDKSPIVEVETVRGWKQKFLSYYDEVSNDVGAKPDYLVKRRKVIEETFNRLEKLADD
jgi:hypothetical protein